MGIPHYMHLGGTRALIGVGPMFSRASWLEDLGTNSEQDLGTDSEQNLTLEKIGINR